MLPPPTTPDTGTTQPPGGEREWCLFLSSQCLLYIFSLLSEVASVTLCNAGVIAGAVVAVIAIVLIILIVLMIVGFLIVTKVRTTMSLPACARFMFQCCCIMFV